MGLDPGGSTRSTLARWPTPGPAFGRPGACFAAEELSRGGLAPLVEGDDELRELLVRRRQLIETLHGKRCRRARAEAAMVRDSIATVIALLSQQLEALDQAIAAHIAARPELARAAVNLRSFTGCGPMLAATLLGEVPELGRVSARRSPR